MRAAALFNKLAGYFRLSGYVQLAKGGPTVLMTTTQMKHIIQRTTDTFAELEEVRRKVILQNYATVDSLIKESVFVIMKKNPT